MLFFCILGGSPRTPTRSNLDFPNIAITPNKYERLYRSLETNGNDSGKTLGNNIDHFTMFNVIVVDINYQIHDESSLAFVCSTNVPSAQKLNSQHIKSRYICFITLNLFKTRFMMALYNLYSLLIA